MIDFAEAWDAIVAARSELELERVGEAIRASDLTEPERAQLRDKYRWKLGLVRLKRAVQVPNSRSPPRVEAAAAEFSAHLDSVALKHHGDFEDDERWEEP
jgi:hypothetical protein